MEDKNKKIEKLTEFINEQGQWFDDYQGHEDNLNNYIECCFEIGSLSYCEIDSDIRPYIKENIESMTLSELFNYCNVELTEGIYRVDNEIASFNLGEIECQITGLCKHDKKGNLITNCIYTDLCKGLSDEEIKKAENNSDYLLSNGCIYIDRSYDRVSVILDVDKLIKSDRSLKEVSLSIDHGFNAIEDKKRGGGWYKFNFENYHIWQIIQNGSLLWQTAILKNDHFINHKTYKTLSGAFKRKI